MIAKIKEETITTDQFRDLLTKVKFDLQRDRFGILCQLFTAKQEKGDGPRLISVPLLKERMGAKEEEERKRPTSMSKKSVKDLKIPPKKKD